MSDSSQSIPYDIEIGKEGNENLERSNEEFELEAETSEENLEWLDKKLEVDDQLSEKGEASLAKIYGYFAGPTIFKRERKADCQEPPELRVVAIGPYHHGQYPLTFDDDYKWKITRFMVQYCEFDAKQYLREMKKQEQTARKCYDEDLSKWSSKDFRTMLLLDSSFILFAMDGFCNMRLDPYGCHQEYMALHLDIREHSKQIKLDLLIVDNQIPFSAIKLLKSCFPGNNGIVESIGDLALECFDDFWPMRNKEKVLQKKGSEEQVTNKGAPWFQHLLCLPGKKTNEEQEMSGSTPDQFHHLLHLFHWSRIPKEGYEMDRGLSKKNASQQYIPSATELQKSSTQFKKNKSGSYLHITFNRRLTNLSGAINIPYLRLYDYSESIFRNLITFEASPTNDVLCFTAYTACMSCILQREDDVKLLRESGIVASTNYKDADVIEFFIKMNREIKDVMMPYTLLEFYYNVTEHHRSPISKRWGNFKLQYCPNFWVGLSLIAAIVLFVLSLLQTIYGMLAYYVPENK